MLQKCYLLTTAYHENTETVFQRSQAYNHSVFCILFSLHFSIGIPVGTHIPEHSIVFLPAALWQIIIKLILMICSYAIFQLSLLGMTG